MDSLVFAVRPPWYRTWWAYLSYAVGVAGLAAAVGIAEPLYQAISAVIMAAAGLAAILLSENKA